MNLTDERLRESLRSKADRVLTPVDVFARVEARAHRIRHNRRVRAILAAAAAVTAVAVIVPMVLTNTARRVAPVSPSPNATSGPTPPGLPSVAADAVFDPNSPWEFRGDRSALDGLAAIQGAWTVKHPDSGAIDPLYGGTPVVWARDTLIFVAKTGDGARWGMATNGPDGVDFLVDQPVATGTTAFVVALSADMGATDLLVVAAPTTKFVRYASDGVSFGNISELTAGVGFIPLIGSQPDGRIQVVGAAGNIVDEGPVPNAAGGAVGAGTGRSGDGSAGTLPPSGPAVPANTVAWPWRGTHLADVAEDADEAYLGWRKANDTAMNGLFLYGGTDAVGTRYVLEQLWLPGDTSADTVGYVRRADGTSQLEIGPKLGLSSAVSVISVTDSAHTSSSSLVVVPRSASDQVLYAASGGTFVVRSSPDGDGVVVISRPTSSDDDQLRIVDVAGNVTFQGKVSSLLCGASACE